MKGRTPRRKASVPLRVFTLEQANEIIPEVQESILWFKDAVQEISQTQDSLSVLELVGAGDVKSPEHRELISKRFQLQRQVQEYQDRLEEFQKLGCLIKDVEGGLVDFYGLKDGRLIFLCWKLGEKRIDHWHEINAGVKGRRPVAEL